MISKITIGQVEVLVMSASCFSIKWKSQEHVIDLIRENGVKLVSICSNPSKRVGKIVNYCYLNGIKVIR